MKHIILILFFCISFVTHANNDLSKYSESLHPNIEDVDVFYENEDFKYRLILYRGGFEHVTAYIVFQKLTNNEHSSKIYSNVPIDEVNNVYNFSIKEISKEEFGFKIVLSAIHSYIYEETEIIIHLSESMEYKVISGLIDLK